MIQLIWGIVNIVTFLGFVIYCVKTASEIRKKVTLSAAFIFCFFALSFIGRQTKDEKDKKFEFENREAKKQPLNGYTAFSQVTLEDDLCSKFVLNVDSDGKNIHSGLITRIGFTSGTEWSTLYITINKTEKKNTFQYQVGGTRIWKILGIPIYQELKDFNGTGEFKPAL